MDFLKKNTTQIIIIVGAVISATLLVIYMYKNHSQLNTLRKQLDWTNQRLSNFTDLPQVHQTSRPTPFVQQPVQSVSPVDHQPPPSVQSVFVPPVDHQPPSPMPPIDTWTCGQMTNDHATLEKTVSFYPTLETIPEVNEYAEVDKEVDEELKKLSSIEEIQE
ncbi:hypothetical protein OAV62_01600 [bacterium]|nr:hypothetical protein [bacterium]